MKNLILIAMSACLAAAFLGCWADKQEGVNDAKTLRFCSKSSSEGLLLVDILDVQSGRRIAEVETKASVYHRFVLNWIAPDKILLISSDIGDKVIIVGDTCECHYASVVITPECAEAQLYEYSAKGGGRVILGTIKFDKNILLNDKRVNKKYLEFKDIPANEEAEKKPLGP